MSPSRQSLKFGAYVPGQATGTSGSRRGAATPPACVDEGRTLLGNGSGGQDPGKLSRHRTDDSLTFVQRGQIDALRLARERIQVSVTISNLDLVVLGDERYNDRLDTTSFASVFRVGSLATRV